MVEPKEQLRMILKGAASCVNEEELLKKLEKGTPLTVKLGLDPSAPDIHLGHAVVLRKIRQMQDLGHRAVIVIGDFTGKIGDPTGRSKGRNALSNEQVKANAATYCEQIFKVLDRGKTSVRFNSEWLGKLTFEEVIRLASITTVARILERDDFQNRYRNQVPIGLHEFFYPLMQAYDSVALNADIELGGSDQTFNVLMGRNLQKVFGQEQQIALFMPLLEGLDGVEKMSKSLGNHIGVNESANVMFKKVMEIPDFLIVRYFELATDEHPDRVEEIKKDLDEGKNPRDVKYELARIITALYHGEQEMESARTYYDQAFAKGSVPDNIPEVSLPGKQIPLIEILPILQEQGMIKSKNEFLRIVKQGGVQLDGEKLTQEELSIAVRNGSVLKIGKKKFLRFC